MVEEPESEALSTFVDAKPTTLATSAIASVEVIRAVGLARPTRAAMSRAEELLSECLLVDVLPDILRSAARLSSETVRTLDAIHLASAQHVEPDGLIAYDRRLADAARAAGFEVFAPS